MIKYLFLLHFLQSFWATSSGKRGYSGVTTYCSTTWAPISCHLDSLTDIEEEKAISNNNNSSTADEKKEQQQQQTTATSPFAGEGRIVETDFGPHAFVLINVYVPNAGERPDRPRLATKLKFLKSLKAHCEALAAQGRRVLLVGDFNVCADERDVHPRIGLENAYSEEERNLFLSFLTDQGGIFVDSWRHLHPDDDVEKNVEKSDSKVTEADTTAAPNTSAGGGSAGVYTVWDEKTSARAFNEGVRIDFVLATTDLLPFIKKCEILGADVLPPKWSDHAGILVEIEETTATETKVENDEVDEEVKGEIKQVFAPPEKHPPCKEWVKLNKRFNDPSQKSIASFFGGGAGGKRKTEEAPAKNDKQESGSTDKRQK